MAQLRLAVAFLVALAITPSLSQAQPPPDKGERVTRSYDIDDLVTKPGAWTMPPGVKDILHENWRLHEKDPSGRVMQVIKNIMKAVDLEAGAFEVENGTRLLVRASAKQHGLIVKSLNAMRGQADLAVFVNAKLYEVDLAFFTKVANAKRYSMADMEKLEQDFLKGKPGTDSSSVFDLLKKQKHVLNGREVKLDLGAETAILSRHQAGSCKAGPEQIKKGDMGTQVFLEGVSVLAGVTVSPDRRFVWLKLREQSTALKVVHKVKAWNGGDEPVDAEVPILDEASHTRTILIPDGGSNLLPVHYRPAGLAKDRAWVLLVTPRILIVEEEKAIQGKIGNPD